MSDGSGLTLDYVPCGRNGSAIVTARLGDDILAHAKVDFGKPDARTRFAADVTQGRPGIDSAAVENELLQIGAELSARHAKPGDKPAEPDAKELLLKMPEPVQQEARAMLESQDLIVRCYNDVAALGVAGEADLVAAVYLIGTSRLLAEPLGAIVQAPSSTGKSYVVEKTAALFPLEAVIYATALTPNALYYMQPGSLRYKFIVAGERSRREDDDSADATKALREMRSSGRLTKMYVDRENGKLVTRIAVQEGPIAYVETTTATDIFNEDANRCLLLSADERPQQTRKVLRRIAAARSGAAAANADAIMQRHHAAQRMLQQRPVVIPFAEQLAERFSDERVEARRAFPQLLGMVEACALLHQFQRQLDSDGRIVATVADYEFARHLCSGPFARLLGGRISDAAIRFYGRLRAWATGKFTTTEAFKHDLKSDRAVRGWLVELAAIGAVEQTAEPKGNRPAEWQLTDMDATEVAVGRFDLPDLRDLKDV